MNSRQDQVSGYIQKQIQIGPQWMSNRIRGPDRVQYKERSIKIRIEALINGFLDGSTKAERWLIMPGLRGVGKTTVVAQTYTWLHLKKKVSPKRMLYISLDECRHLATNLNDLLDAYSNYLGREWVYINEPVFVFVDEVHIDSNWPATIKTIYEKTRLVFFVCTGSSATGLQIQADTHRRARVERLYPLNFTEYQLLANGIFPAKGLKEKLINAIYFSPNAGAAFEKLSNLQEAVSDQWSRYDKSGLDGYIYRHSLTYSLGTSDESFVFYEKLRGALGQILANDMVNHSFRPATINVIGQLLFLLANTSSTVSFQKLNRILKTTDRQLAKILDALTDAEVLIKVPAWGDHFASTRKPSRYQFMSPAIRVALQALSADPQMNQRRRGQLLEDLASLHYYREFQQRGGRGQLTHRIGKDNIRSADFLLKLIDSQPIAIEFGSSNKGYGQVETTMAQTDCLYGIVFSSGTLAINQEKTAIRVPLDYFYLM